MFMDTPSTDAKKQLVETILLMCADPKLLKKSGADERT